MCLLSPAGGLGPEHGHGAKVLLPLARLGATPSAATLAAAHARLAAGAAARTLWLAPCQTALRALPQLGAPAPAALSQALAVSAAAHTCGVLRDWVQLASGPDVDTAAIEAGIWGRVRVPLRLNSDGGARTLAALEAEVAALAARLCAECEAVAAGAAPRAALQLEREPKGEAGASLEVRVHASAVQLLGRLQGALDAEGEGRAERYPPHEFAGL